MSLFEVLHERNNINFENLTHIDNIYSQQRLGGVVKSYRDYALEVIEEIGNQDEFTLGLSSKTDDYIKRTHGITNAHFKNEPTNPAVLINSLWLIASRKIKKSKRDNLMDMDMFHNFDYINGNEFLDTPFDSTRTPYDSRLFGFFIDTLQNMSGVKKRKDYLEIEDVWINNNLKQLLESGNSSSIDMLNEFLRKELKVKEDTIELDIQEFDMCYKHERSKVPLVDIANLYPYDHNKFQFHQWNYYFDEETGKVKGYELQERKIPIIIDHKTMGAVHFSVAKTDFDEPIEELFDEIDEYDAHLSQMFDEVEDEEDIQFHTEFKHYKKKIQSIVVTESLLDKLV